MTLRRSVRFVGLDDEAAPLLTAFAGSSQRPPRGDTPMPPAAQPLSLTDSLKRRLSTHLGMAEGPAEKRNCTLELGRQELATTAPRPEPGMVRVPALARQPTPPASAPPQQQQQQQQADHGTGMAGYHVVLPPQPRLPPIAAAALAQPVRGLLAAILQRPRSSSLSLQRAASAPAAAHPWAAPLTQRTQASTQQQQQQQQQATGGDSLLRAASEPPNHCAPAPMRMAPGTTQKQLKAVEEAPEPQGLEEEDQGSSNGSDALSGDCFSCCDSFVDSVHGSGPGYSVIDSASSLSALEEVSSRPLSAAELRRMAAGVVDIAGFPVPHIECPVPSLAHELAAANACVARMVHPEACVFYPVHGSSEILQVTCYYQVPLISVCLGASYLQRLMFKDSPLLLAAKQAGWFVKEGNGICMRFSLADPKLVAFLITCIYIALKVSSRVPFRQQLSGMLAMVLPQYSQQGWHSQAVSLERYCLEKLNWRLGPYFATEADEQA